MNGNFHKYVAPLVEVIKDLQDQAYQERVWLKGIGPECDSFDESINTFFDLYDPIRQELHKKEYNLSQQQIHLIHSLADKLIEYSCEVNFIESASVVLSDPKWHAVRNYAKEVYTELTKSQSCT